MSVNLAQVEASAKRLFPDLSVEQDYFDWELAVTGVSDMAKEIQRLKSLGRSPCVFM